MDKDKEDFFKEVPNQADLFPEEVKEEKNREIESVLDSFWADVPLKDVEEYYKAGKLANSHAPGIRMGREFMNGFIASYIDVAKKILRDENRSVTPQQKSLFKLIIFFIFEYQFILKTSIYVLINYFKFVDE